ncbi:transporter substrate-binding domain-containing protein [Undibacterium seohonense]|uniref:Transporter substrate-binding domain-containing protein n=1 Tax=Undibacterium seohonense TaxID=1344950 RepID=A0ABR6X9C6_9BURK|nr:transporter substrate-binding domain-containing protein [Undibacterium seohonense]MBC3809538.1 transporter substrate-binding domain-containing protein [Undibacterium seohonense]
MFNIKQAKHLHSKVSLVCLSFLLVFCDLSAAQTKKPTIKITTEYLFPQNITDKDSTAIYGQSADKVHELFKRSQLPYQMSIMSWNRAFELARKNADTCVFSTVRTKDREASFVWIGPISVGNWAVFGSPDKFGKVTRLEDIKQSSIGTEAGNVSVLYLSEKGFQMVTSIESTTTFKNVALGRIEYATAGDTHGKKIIMENHLEDKVVWLFNYHSSDYYLACNANMNAETTNLLNLKLREMKADGTYKNIDNKY